MAEDQNAAVIINGVGFSPLPGVKYKHDYVKISHVINTPSEWGKALSLPENFPPEQLTKEFVEKFFYRYLVLNDLWFILCFVLETPEVNRPFIINACHEVETGGDWTIDLWARFHYKSSIRKARNVQRLLKYPSKCQMIVSHTRPAAKKHMIPIMLVLENSVFLKTLFDDILYSKPKTESSKWSEDGGIVTKGHQSARPESNLEAWGLKDGMPIGAHFDFIDIDDLETKDDVKNLDVVLQVRDAVDLCNFLLTENGVISFWGTPYSHEGVYVPHVIEKKKADGTPKYKFRRKPCTDNGEVTGNPVMMDKDKMLDLFAELGKDEGMYAVNCQMLINPTPLGSIKLHSEYIIECEPEMIPKQNLIKIMAIDPAGDNKNGKGDSWAILTVGIDPKPDDIGASNVYILDAVISPLGETEAVEEIVRMYLRGGIIEKIGIEKVGLSSVELHVSRALAVRGRSISVENGSLEILRPAGREKKQRITSYLSWPLDNGKIHMSKSISSVYRERIKRECDKFPFFHDDALDALAYSFEMQKNLDIGRYSISNQYDYSHQKQYAAVI